ncbi:MAG: sigma 54-interacting transcriptional regulator [Proteobacteria bacterium]|nr:sigma 54-interacting transcriptional regulator [Pseudomonadota bacterium]
MPARILIVDDEESIRFTIQSFLKREGHEVFTADCHQAAVTAISTHDFDVVIADIVLPGSSGIDLLREIKTRGLQCPVLMITGMPDIETASDAVRLGAFDYLPKPVRRATLLRIVSQALRHKTVLDEKNRIEAERERFRTHLEAIFRSVEEGIVSVNNETEVIEINQAALDICGLTREESIGRSWRTITSDCSAQCHQPLLETLDREIVVRDFRVECRHPDRPTRSIVLNTSPLKDRSGRFIGAVVVIRDITILVNLERELDQRKQFHNLIGRSKSMQRVYRLIENLAETEATALILGESGTGKELVAEALHYLSSRQNGPLVKVNCSALAENLLESELFGHVRGAFTGALKDKTGRFEMAAGGTIMLDEIADLSPRIQLKLLRVIQEKEIERVGDEGPRKVDVRIIACTNRDIKTMVQRGEFREDLYFRLNVVQVRLPPLRERREDIQPLIEHFIAHYNAQYNKTIQGISPEARQLLFNYAWPGNIRELRHAIEHAFVLCHLPCITPEHLPPEIRDATTAERPVHLKALSPADEAGLLKDVLEETGWNKAEAARRLGWSRPTIYRKIARYRLLPGL